MDFTVDGINNLISKMPLFVLVLFRMGGLFFTAPVFSHMSVPLKMKVSLSLFLALVIFPTVQFIPFTLPYTIISFGLIVVKEVAVGAIIGFMASMTFFVFSLAGMIAGRQVAMEMASTLSPNTETGGSITGLLYYMVGAMVFLAINGHHWLIKALAFSYNAVPLGGFQFTPRLSDKMVESFSVYFALGVRMAAPFIIVALITLVIVGVVLKVTEQHSLFVLELPLKSMVGFYLFVVSAPYIINFMRSVLDPLQNDIVNLLRYLR
ncbi:MAG: flagellar biosynthetic protein FliR [Candidatus Anammoxibacter sp.]